MMQMPIYFDYMATTPVDPKVIEVMDAHLGFGGVFGNPASTTHIYGQMAAKAVEQARMKIAKAIGANPAELVFTSGATESDNLALFGAARFYQAKGKHLITMASEHKAVLDSFQALEEEGFDVTYLQPKSNGLLDLQTLKEALTPETILVSIMHVNNEIGVIQDIASIGALLKERGIIFHVDAAQSAGKLPINLAELPVDLMSFSAHKNYGPKGIGALYVRRKPRVRLCPITFGGGHEGGLRSGTLATHQIAGMGEAFRISAVQGVEENKRILRLRQRLWQGIKHLPGVRLNGDEQQRIAGNLNILFAGIEGDSLLYGLNELAVSSTSACSSASAKPSYVLKSIGLDDEQALSSVRLSLGRFTTEADVEKAIAVICEQVARLYELSDV